jgi:heparan-alpha-glucosaminide N-acetyltransferase
MLLLLPDITGGFSFHVMHRQFPDDPWWAALAAAFTHVQWSGASIWDLIMPSFVFLVGAAMPLSAFARRGRGNTRGEVVWHQCLRASALFVLALLLTMPLLTRLAELWPLGFLVIALPVPRWAARAWGLPRTGERWLETVWWLGILVAAAAWIYLHIAERGNYDLGHVFTAMALASVPAFLVVGRPRTVQFGAAFVVLAGYWLLFALYPLPAPGFDLASVGVSPGDELFSGFFAHWNKNTNVAAAFDVWLLNMLPRPQPFLFQGNGVQTLQFVPIIATMIFGVIAGELLRSNRAKMEIRTTLVVGGALGIGAGLLAGRWLCPLVKSIWTPSWTLFSAGIAAVVLGALYHLCDVRTPRAWVLVFVVIGTNSVLLYTLASCYRWRLLQLPRELMAATPLSFGSLAPVADSVMFGAGLWLIAFVLYRSRVFVRL